MSEEKEARILTRHQSLWERQVPGAQSFWGAYIPHRGQVVETERQAKLGESSDPGEGGLEHMVLDANICARWGGGGGHRRPPGTTRVISYLLRSPGEQASQGKDSEVKQGRQKLVKCKDFQNTANSFWV